MKTEEGEVEKYVIKKDVIDIFKNHNVNYFLIPLDTETNDDYDNIINMIRMADGVLIPGGKKGGNIELDVIRYLYDNDVPTLGICFGMQNMGKVLNGKRKGVENHMWPHKAKYVHDVTILKDTLLYEILKKEKITVNSRHNYVLDYTDMKISALSQEGYIEAIEDTSKKCFLGVVWHPETTGDENTMKIFNYFISKL